HRRRVARHPDSSLLPARMTAPPVLGRTEYYRLRLTELPGLERAARRHTAPRRDPPPRAPRLVKKSRPELRAPAPRSCPFGPSAAARRCRIRNTPLAHLGD